MVSSGLAPGMVSVAPVRLAIHLGLAFLILGLIAWYVMALRRTEADLLQARRQRNEGLMAWGTALTALTFVQILLGALVAGLDAGRTYMEWPLMGGGLFPPDHRVAAYLLLVVALIAWVRSRRSAMVHIRRAFDAMILMVLAQVGLGIATVLHGAQLHVALTHQAGAVATFVLILRARFAALHPRAQKIARG